MMTVAHCTHSFTTTPVHSFALACLLFSGHSIYFCPCGIMFPAPSAGASAPTVPTTGPGPAAVAREAALAAREAAADALWNQAQAQLHFQGQLQAWLDGEDRRQDARELSQDAREAALDARIQDCEAERLSLRGWRQELDSWDAHLREKHAFLVREGEELNRRRVEMGIDSPGVATPIASPGVASHGSVYSPVPPSSSPAPPPDPNDLR